MLDWICASEEKKTKCQEANKVYRKKNPSVVGHNSKYKNYGINMEQVSYETLVPLQ